MKKNILNQSGLSLVESLVGLAITAAAGAAYMTHLQTVARNESIQKSKGTITHFEAQTAEYLKSKDVCNINMFKAFQNVKLDQANVEGSVDQKVLWNKGFMDKEGKLHQKAIFKINDSYDGDRVWISDVSYKLEDLQDISILNSPWNKSGKLNIKIVFERCATGGPVYRLVNGAKVPVCSNIVRQGKNHEKMAAFRVDNQGNISLKNGKIFNKATQLWEADPAKKVPIAACADSQDALVDEANRYADLKACLTEIRVMSLGGISGDTTCGFKVESKKHDEPLSVGTHQKDFSYAAGKVKITLISGGGGGGEGDNDNPGKGGFAGQYYEGSVENGDSLGKCDIVVGGGGRGGSKGSSNLLNYTEESGERGSETSVRCQNFNQILSGGNGGSGRSTGRIGTPGQNLIHKLTIISKGGNGGDRAAGSPGESGAGGGGGGDRKNDGGQGGNGVAIFEYNEVKIFNRNGEVFSVKEIFNLEKSGQLAATLGEELAGP